MEDENQTDVKSMLEIKTHLISHHLWSVLA